MISTTPANLPPTDGPPIPAVVLGGAGYVSGELLRLLASHPSIELRTALSASHAGEPVAALFPHLTSALGTLRFTDRAQPEALATVLSGLRQEGATRVALFSAAPHGASAAQIDRLLIAAEEAGLAPRLVDLSADFRSQDQDEYEAIYGQTHGQPHGAPHRLQQFVCALPEHLATTPAAGMHVGHPGCFTTAVTLATVALLASGAVEPEFQVCAVTGSTGSGRGAGASTHHPERQSNLWAYRPLAHRHGPEMTRLAAAATGIKPRIAFIPHSGPFARGIHATVQGRLRQPITARELRARVAEYYAEAPFVEVVEQPPRLKDVVGSHHCRLAFAVDDQGGVAAFSVIDNLIKGAAGGAIHWMNRMLGLPETDGLTQPGLGWT